MRFLRALEDRSVDNRLLIAVTAVRLRPFAEGVREQVREMFVERRPA